MESESLVVIGASSDPFKSGSMLIKVLQDVGYTGKVAGINPKGGEVYGTKLYKTLDDVPFRPDLGVLHIQPRFIPEVVKNCALIGMKGIVISSEGFAESDEKGKQYQRELKEILKSSGMRGFGPNTLGIINTSTKLTTSYFSDHDMMTPGSIGFIAQSGIFIGALLRYISSIDNLKISKGLGLGNKVDVDESDALEYLLQDEQTRTIGMYLEDIRDGRRFLETARRASTQKPVLLLKGGRTAQGAHASASHTASMAVDDAVFDGSLRQAGVVRMKGIEELVSNLMAFEWMPLPKGNQIALVTFSGAQAIMSVDAAVEEGLSLAKFSESTRADISTVIANSYKAQNPIDIFPDMMTHGFEKTHLEILKALLKDDGVHGIVLISFVMDGPKPFYPLVELLNQHHDKPVFITLMGPKEDVRNCGDYLASQKIPCYPFPETAVRVFSNMWNYRKNTR